MNRRRKIHVIHVTKCDLYDSLVNCWRSYGNLIICRYINQHRSWHFSCRPILFVDTLHIKWFGCLGGYFKCTWDYIFYTTFRSIVGGSQKFIRQLMYDIPDQQLSYSCIILSDEYTLVKRCGLRCVLLRWLRLSAQLWPSFTDREMRSVTRKQQRRYCSKKWT